MRAARLLRGVALLIAIARSSMAAECPTAGRPFIEVVVEVEPPDRIIADTLVKHLRAELSSRGIEVCEQAASRSQLGRVKLHVKRDGKGSVVAVIGLEDTLMKKEVTREIDLTALPDDARPTTVATSADELLRAAWAELTLADAPPPTSPPPAEVVEALRSTQKELASRDNTELGAFASGAVARRRTAVGGGLFANGWLSPRVGIASMLEGGRGLSVESVDGHSRIDTVSIGLGPTVSPFADHARSGVRFESLVHGTLALSSGDAAPTAHGSSATAGSVEVSAGVRAWLRAGPLGWTLGAAFRIPLRPVRADDEQRVVTALEGPSGVLTLGVAVVR
jgi:hypothetical protein